MEEKKNKPIIRLYQRDRDKMKEVGVIWLNVSKDGKEYYIVRIGELELVGFNA